MSGLIVACASALWLGILTSVSPCPLATNIAAVSFLSKKISHPRAVLLAGMAYTAGRMAAYAVLGAVIIGSLVSIPAVAAFLQRYMNRILGPVLFIAGLFLIDAFRFRVPGLTLSQEDQESLAANGLAGSFLLGALFALAFCPVSAALFFGGVIPLSLSSAYGIALPFVYGVGTGLPVLVFSFSIAFGFTTLSRLFHRMAAFERYTRKITGAVFILVGLYCMWAFIIAVLIR